MVPGFGDFRVLSYDRRGHCAAKRPATMELRRDGERTPALLEALDLAPATWSELRRCNIALRSRPASDLFRSLGHDRRYGLLERPASKFWSARSQLEAVGSDAPATTRRRAQFVESRLRSRRVGHHYRLIESVFVRNAPTFLAELRARTRPHTRSASRLKSLAHKRLEARRSSCA